MAVTTLNIGERKPPRGKYTWIPPSVIDEIDDIKREEDIVVGSEAFRRMVKYCRVGREVKRIIKLDFSKSTQRLPVEMFDTTIPDPFRDTKSKKKKWKKNNNRMANKDTRKDIRLNLKDIDLGNLGNF